MVALYGDRVVAETLALATRAGELSDIDMHGGGTTRPTWSVLLNGLAVIVAWLLIVILLAWLFAPHNVNPSASITDSSVPLVVQDTETPPKQLQHDTGDMVGILRASAVPMF